ncbi:hypothetical protein [Xanthomonas translucens]|uniref:hypothetical protein n=1 Tax=Xanthomonas campestris pv. translucens TaxID=343 RepID=UPI0012D9E156
MKSHRRQRRSRRFPNASAYVRRSRTRHAQAREHPRPIFLFVTLRIPSRIDLVDDRHPHLHQRQVLVDGLSELPVTVFTIALLRPPVALQ